jgi:hypothetical protein
VHPVTEDRDSPIPAAPRRRRRYVLIWLTAWLLCLAWNYSHHMSRGRGVGQPLVWGSDSHHYYAWARALWIDGTVDHSDDFRFQGEGYRRAGVPWRYWIRNKLGNERRWTGTGLPHNKYGLGTALLAGPAMLSARAAVRGYEQWTGRPVSRFAAIYQIAWLFSLITAGFLGLWFSFLVLADLFDDAIAFRAVALGFVGTSLLFYIWFDSVMAHGPGFGVCALFVLLCQRWHRRLIAAAEGGAGLGRLIGPAVAMGAALSLATMVRYTNALFVLLPITMAVVEVARGRVGWGKQARLVWPSGLIAVVAGAIAFIPQLLAWNAMFDVWILDTYSRERHFWWPKFAHRVLFSPINSLFVWTPLAGVAIIGLIAAAWRWRRPTAIGGLVVFAAMLWTYGGWECWWLGYSYGARGLSECTIFFMIGIGAALAWRRSARGSRRWLARGAVALILLLTAWNVYFLECCRAEIQPPESPFAGAALFENWPTLREQLREDFDPVRMWRADRYPLFTPEPPPGELIPPTR